jgi:hypothetical protein
MDPPNDTSAIYGEAYFEGGVDDGYASYGATEPVLRREFARALMRLRRHVQGGKLVEIGCAYGVFLDVAREHFDVVGFELSEAAAARAKQRGLDVVTRAPTAELFASRGPFDAAVMLDVIEHLESPAEILRSLRSHLRGPLLLTTGDFGSVLARASGKRWRLMTPPQHLHFFTQGSLRALLARTGYRVIETTRPSKLVPVNLAVHQLGRAVPVLRRLAPRVPAWLWAPVNLFDTVQLIAG